MSIVWTSYTNDHSGSWPNNSISTIGSASVVVVDPRYESGFRPTYQPFPNRFSCDQKYKEIHQRLFADGPKLKFVPSEKFAGPLFGYVFYSGQEGLGYYIDPMVMRYVYYS